MWRDINLDVDIKKKNYLNIEVNQADDLLLTIYLYNNGVPLNLVSGEDTVIVNYVNANNTITSDSNIGKSFTNNLLKIYLNKNCTNSYGVAKMQVTINTTKKDVTNRQVTTFPIEIKVNKSIMDGQEVSKNVNSMINDLNTCIINAKEIIKNIEEAEKLYPSTSDLYTDVQSLNTRKMGSINLLRDAGFISRNIGDGFDWKLYNPNSDASAKVEESTTSLSRLCAKITVGENIQRGIYQQVYSYDKGTDYTITCKVKGTAGYVIRFKLSGSVEREYTIQNDDEWESVVIKFSNKNIPTTWDTAFCIYGMKTGTFYVENVLLCEGGNPITFAYNPVDLVGKRLKISGQDVLDIEQEGLYCGSNCINAPENNCWFYYDIKIHSTTYKSITAFSYNFNKVYIKTSENGIWRDWEQITTQTLAKNPANINQDSTHRFTTDEEKKLWNKYTRVFKQSFNNVTNVTVSCSSNVTSDHVVADFFIGNKENITDFSWKVNNTVIRTETGGGVVILHIDFGRTSTNTWIYRITGKIEITSAGEYTIDHIGTITGTTEITSLGLATNGTDNFNRCSAIIKKY